MAGTCMVGRFFFLPGTFSATPCFPSSCTCQDGLEWTKVSVSVAFWDGEEQLPSWHFILVGMPSPSPSGAFYFLQVMSSSSAQRRRGGREGKALQGSPWQLVNFSFTTFLLERPPVADMAAFALSPVSHFSGSSPCPRLPSSFLPDTCSLPMAELYSPSGDWAA